MNDWVLFTMLCMVIAILAAIWARLGQRLADESSIDVDRMAQAMAVRAISSFGTDAIPLDDLRLYVRVNYLEICAQTGITESYLTTIQDLTCNKIMTMLTDSDKKTTQENFLYG